MRMYSLYINRLSCLFQAAAIAIQAHTRGCFGRSRSIKARFAKAARIAATRTHAAKVMQVTSPCMLNTRTEETNTAIYSYAVCFVNTFGGLILTRIAKPARIAATREHAAKVMQVTSQAVELQSSDS